MMQPSLDNHDIFASVREGKLPAIAHVALSRSSIFRQQPRRDISALNMSEAHPLQSMKPIPAPAKNFHHPSIPRPITCSQLSQSSKKFSDFLLRRFKTQVGGLPWIGRRRRFRNSFRAAYRFFASVCGLCMSHRSNFFASRQTLYSLPHPPSL